MVEFITTNFKKCKHLLGFEIDEYTTNEQLREDKGVIYSLRSCKKCGKIVSVTQRIK